MRGHKQSDSGGEKNSAKDHGEENRPTEGGAALLPGFKGKDARGGLGIDETSLGPALNRGFELGALLHGLARSGVTSDCELAELRSRILVLPVIRHHTTGTCRMQWWGQAG